MLGGFVNISRCHCPAEDVCVAVCTGDKGIALLDGLYARACRIHTSRPIETNRRHVAVPLFGKGFILGSTQLGLEARASAGQRSICGAARVIDEVIALVARLRGVPIGIDIRVGTNCLLVEQNIVASPLQCPLDKGG